MPAQSTDRGRTSGSEDDRPGEPGVLSMNLFFLLLLGPSSFLHPLGPGCAVPGEHPRSDSCATTILDRRPLFESDDPAEEAECGESTADGVAPQLGFVPARWKGADPRRV